MESCLVAEPKLEWDEVTDWCSADLKAKSLASTLCKLSFAATVYHLWRHQNDLLHGNIPRSEKSIVAQINWEVPSKVVARGAFSSSVQNRKLVHNWNLYIVL
jgi:hypothetical protein